MSEYSAECHAANRIAAQLRGLPALPKRQARVKAGRAVRAYATGIPGKGGYLRVAMDARLLDVLAYCREFFEQNDQIPPQGCISKRFGVTETVAQKYIHGLGDAGHLERNEVGKWRFKRPERA